MKIEISPEADKYISQNGGEVFITRGKIAGCCGVAAPRPSISIGSPKDKSLYSLKNYYDISLFVDKQVSESSKISISLSKLLWVKALYVEVIE